MTGASDIRRVSEMERLARQQAEAEPWPEGVSARYMNLAGATTDIRESTGGYTTAACQGCLYAWTGDVIAAHGRAQTHAEKCRALPRPT